MRRLVGRVEEFRQPRGCLSLPVLGFMAINVQEHLGTGVAEQGSGGLRVHACLQQFGRSGVTEIVDLRSVDARILAEPRPFSTAKICSVEELPLRSSKHEV